MEEYKTGNRIQYVGYNFDLSQASGDFTINLNFKPKAFTVFAVADASLLRSHGMGSPDTSGNPVDRCMYWDAANARMALSNLYFAFCDNSGTILGTFNSVAYLDNGFKFHYTKTGANAGTFSFGFLFFE